MAAALTRRYDARCNRAGGRFQGEVHLSRQRAQVPQFLLPGDAPVEHRNMNDERRQPDPRGRTGVDLVVQQPALRRAN